MTSTAEDSNMEFINLSRKVNILLFKNEKLVLVQFAIYHKNDILVLYDIYKFK